MQRPSMQRPMMDPMFVDKHHKGGGAGLAVFKMVAFSIKWFFRFLVSNPFSVKKNQLEPPVRPGRLLVRVAASWLVFLPFVLAGTAFVLVYAATHPKAPAALTDPNSQGVFFDPVEFVSGDGTKLNGWLIPEINAKRVLDDKERSLRLRHPAVVLVHDFGQSPQQMLPLLLPLHEEGVVQLAVALRGQGGDRPSAQTFGLKEWQDVKAAVQVLQAEPFVDPTRIAVIGVGSGANAALLAASHDSTIRAIVLADPFKNCDDAIARKVAPKQPWLRWMRPLCKWTFELSYHVDGDDITLDQYAQLISNKPSLVFKDGDQQRIRFLDPSTVEQVRKFCRKELRTSEASMASASN